MSVSEVFTVRVVEFGGWTVSVSEVFTVRVVEFGG